MTRGKQLKTMIGAFTQIEKPKTFFDRFFTTPDINISATKTIDFDVIFGEDEIALDISRGGDANKNEFGDFANNEFTPPSFDEEGNVNADEFFDRQVGQKEETSHC